MTIASRYKRVKTAWRHRCSPRSASNNETLALSKRALHGCAASSRQGCVSIIVSRAFHRRDRTLGGVAWQRFARRRSGGAVISDKSGPRRRKGAAILLRRLASTRAKKAVKKRQDLSIVTLGISSSLIYLARVMRITLRACEAPHVNKASRLCRRKKEGVEGRSIALYARAA